MTDMECLGDGMCRGVGMNSDLTTQASSVDSSSPKRSGTYRLNKGTMPDKSSILPGSRGPKWAKCALNGSL